MPEALVIPGFLSIAPRIWEGKGRAEVVQHRLAGLAELPEISDWKRECWYLPREVARRMGVRMPEQRMEAAPRLQGWLASSRLVQVWDVDAKRALKAGEQAVFLAYHRVAGGGTLELHQGENFRGFSGVDYGLFDQMGGGQGEETDEAEERPDLARTYDRVLRALSAEQFSLYDIDLAVLATGIPLSELGSWEAEAAWIEAQAEPRRVLAEELQKLLAGATVEQLDLPGGYRAQRVQEAAFVLKSSRDLEVGGPPIEVPATVSWWVEDVATFAPPQRQERILQARMGRSPLADRRQLASGSMVGAAAFIGLLLVWLALH